MRRWTTLVTWLCLALGVLSSASVDARPRRRRATRRHGASRAPIAMYHANNNRWHDAAAVPAARFTEDGRMVLRMVSINGRGSAEVTPQRAEGGFDEAACAQVAQVASDARTNRVHPIDRRLIEMVYEIARHFHAGQVTVVSGYRAESRHSNHSLGRAIDIIVPGVRDGAVAEFARTLGFAGVGVYPSSGFVHVDVREASFFWVDSSAPGRRTRYRRGRRGGTFHEVLGTQARAADVAARGRGVRPFGGMSGSTDPTQGGLEATPPSPTEDDEADEAEGADPASGR